MGDTTPGPAGPDASALSGVRRSARELADGIRATGRWQRLRVAMVGGWILASLLALFIACPSRGPGNSIGADVQVLSDSLLGGQQILVRNESEEVWTDVELTLDGGWRHALRSLRPREQVVLSPSQFMRGSEAAPRDLRPRTLTIRCRQGKAQVELR